MLNDLLREFDPTLFQFSPDLTTPPPMDDWNPFPATEATQNDPFDEGALLQICSPAVAMGPMVQTEEILYEFLINDKGEAVSSTALVAAEIPIANDHTYSYIQQDISQFNEAAVLVPSVSLESDVSVRAPSPRTELWGALDGQVDIKLRVEEHADCSYSPINKQFHVKTMSKFAVTAVMTGL